MKRLLITAAALLALAGCGTATTAGPAAPDITEAIAGQVERLMVGDRDHLCATYGDCTGRPCRTMIAASADGGETWTHHPLPLDTYPARRPHVNGLIFDLIVVTPTTLRVRSWHEDRSWFSTDAGATWTRAPRDAADPVPSVPAGFVPLDIALRSVGGVGTFLWAADPVTGEAVPVKVPDRADTQHSLPGRPADDMWLSSLHSGTMDVFASHDRGVSWQTATLPVGPNGATMTAGPDGTVYVLAGNTIAVNRSTDGGRRWETIRPAGFAKGVLIDGAIVLPQGGLLLSARRADRSRTGYRSVDGGRTFQELPDLDHDLDTIPAGGFIDRMPRTWESHQDRLLLSDDGLTWHEVTAPTTR
ncbi:beta propeller repeat protein [Catenuloplanes japonicus]|uniref:sialidase family protein n=1 Tax=Catenuloplanes japonicus TaxID=33876 RepID=UPI000526E727|nr:sialidase family protein [Catenuloplanes japonicus]